MSRRNVEAAQRAFDAFNRGDIEAFLELVHPEVEWHPEFQTMMLGGEAREFRGLEGVRAALREWYGVLAEIHIEIAEVRDLGERIVALGRIRARGKESGAPVESPAGYVIELKDAKAIRIWEYLDPKEALEAAGLEEKAMSRNVEVLWGEIEATNRQDADAFVATASPDVEWEDAVFWTEPLRTFRGRAELREWFERVVVEPWQSIHCEVDEIAEATEGRVFYRLIVTARGKDSGVETELRVWCVNWFVGGLATRRRVFRHRPEALEAAGLSG